MRIFPAFCAVTAAVVALASPGAALADTATDYNLFVIGSMTASNSDVQGRAAVGGSATISNYSVGTHASPAGVNFVVGGNLNASSGTGVGKTVVGGSHTLSSFTTSLQPSGTALPVDFTAEANRLVGLAANLSGYAANATASNAYGTLTLAGVASGLNVFDISSSLLASANGIKINLAAGATALINVSGAAASISNLQIWLEGSASSSNILWNFYDATTLSFSGVTVRGSVLAPTAAYLGGNGNIEGTLIVNSFGNKNGTTELHSGFDYKGGLLTPSVPEPASWALMIAGFGMVGGLLRRRAAKAPALA